MSGEDARARRIAGTGLSSEVRRRQLATLLHHSPDATIILDSQGRVSEWNPAAEMLLGRQGSDVVGTVASTLVPRPLRARYDAAWAHLVSGGATAASEVITLERGGDGVTVGAHLAAIRENGRFEGLVAILKVVPVTSAPPDPDLRPDKAGPERRLDLARSNPATRSSADERVDELTGLPGRRRIQERLAEARPEDTALGVVVVDIDAFALVNEAYGPDAGDAVLRELARRLVTVSGSATLGRWQGDAFVLVVEADDPVPILERLAADVAAALDEPFRLDGEDLRLTVSLGLATTELAPEGDLLAAARDALHAAKDAGRDQVTWYSPALRSTSSGAFRLANDLQIGIRKGDLQLHFQPIVALPGIDVVGVEALVRWERDGVGLLAPEAFLDVAERTGQIVLLGAWVAREACRVAAALAQVPHGPRSVSINVSARQFGEPGLLEMLVDAVRDGGCDPSAIIVEVTETALMYDLATTTVTLEALKGLGLGLDLDDFGTGYSSLISLRQFPVDRIKIDRSFVSGLGSSYADTAIVASTIALAHSIGIEAVAEGVETIEQLEILRLMGCDFAQGYLFSGPLRLEALRGWLTAHEPARFASSALVTDRSPFPSAGFEWAVAQIREEAADEGDAVTGSRGVAGDEREDLADIREALADMREVLADMREALADVRDEIADTRDDVAAERHDVADVREDDAPTRPAREATTAEPADAGTGRAAASDDRVARTDERVDAEREREAALVGRETDAEERARPQSDRDDADADADRHPGGPHGS